jgi:DNA mismatch endonuclease (patch repair protein)
MNDQRTPSAQGSIVERPSDTVASPARRRLDPMARRALMARFKSKDTAPERAFRSALRTSGLTGYRLHVQGLPGRPDIVYTRWKVAVFVDGGFWHGHPALFQFGTKGAYWDDKIRRNQERDRRVSAQLTAEGWHVLRFWDLDLLKDPRPALTTVARVLHERGRPLRRGPGEDREDLVAR